MATRVNQTLKIKPVAYDYNSEPDSGIVSGESFNCTKPFMIFSSMPIPKSSKVYMEVTVTYHPDNNTIRHIPLYLGIHKEPSYGILVNDCVLASIYYSTTQDFIIKEKTLGSTVFTESSVPKLYAKIPIVKTVIGLGVDTFTNTISIYSDGKLFYSFSPKLFNIIDSTKSWYFILYNELSESINGKLNFGRYKTEYLPDGYCTLYQHYWNHENLSLDIDSTLTVPGDAYTGFRLYNFPCKCIIENPIAPLDSDNHRHPYLINVRSSMTYSTDNTFQMTPRTSDTDYDISTVNYPCPIDQKIYIEINVKEASMLSGMYGVPLRFGVSSKINDISEKSFRVNLFHRKGDTFDTYSVVNGTQLMHKIPEIDNPSIPVQPETIGLIFDLANNHLQIITNNSVFADIPIEGVDFSTPQGIAYIFFQSADEAYSGIGYNVVNFGTDVIDFTLASDVISFYDYWNEYIRFYLESYPEFPCRMKVRPYYTKYSWYMYCKLTVPRSDNANSLDFTPGLNMLYDTYNIITDTETHNNDPALNPYNYKALVEKDLKENATKHYFGDLNVGFPCTMVIENSRFHNYDINGTLTLGADVVFDIDMTMEVIDYEIIAGYKTREIIGLVEIRNRKYIINVVAGELTVTKDYIDKDINATVSIDKVDTSYDIDGTVTLE